MRARISRSHCLSKVASDAAATTNLAMATVVSQCWAATVSDFAATAVANGQPTLLHHSFGASVVRRLAVVVGRC